MVFYWQSCRHVFKEGAMGAHKIERPRFRPNVGLVITSVDKLILAGLRLSPNNGNQALWQLPQGGIDAGETVKQAALRELAEEVGLMPTDVGKLRVLQARTCYVFPPHTIKRDGYDGQEQQWVHIGFLGEGLPDLTRATDNEFVRLAWMTPANIMAACWQTRVPSYTKVFAELRGLRMID
jgi:putative (di)nucleoside polyphosphate hydrolase